MSGQTEVNVLADYIDLRFVKKALRPRPWDDADTRSPMFMSRPRGQTVFHVILDIFCCLDVASVPLFGG